MALPKLNIPLKLPDRRARAFAGAKLRAWWDGAEVDVEAVETKLAIAEAEEVCEADPAAEDPRLMALQALWGEGAIEPVPEGFADALMARLGDLPDGPVAVLGGGLGPLLLELQEKLDRKVHAYEWRGEIAGAAKLRVTRARKPLVISVEACDPEMMRLPEGLAAVLVLDDAVYIDNLARLLKEAHKSLVPGGRILVTAWSAIARAPVEAAFAAAFAEPHLRSGDDLESLMTNAGFEGIESTDNSLDWAGAARNRLKAALDAFTAGAGDPVMVREMAWELEGWQARLQLMAQGALFRLTVVGAQPPATESGSAE
jgi:SAM-dependent methyltransferase